MIRKNSRATAYSAYKASTAIAAAMLAFGTATAAHAEDEADSGNTIILTTADICLSDASYWIIIHGDRYLIRTTTTIFISSGNSISCCFAWA